MGVDVEHDFAPTYEVLAGQEGAGRAQEVRQGRLARSTWRPTWTARARPSPGTWPRPWACRPTQVRRVIFNEITAPAIHEAFAHPRDIDMNKVNAQQARRILDRIVGYEVSPAAVEEGRHGPVGRPRAVGRRPPDRRPRARDRGLHPRGVLADRRHLHHRTAARPTTWPTAGRPSSTQTDETGQPAPAQASRNSWPSIRPSAPSWSSWKGQKFKADSAEHAALEVARALGAGRRRGPASPRTPRARAPPQLRRRSSAT